MGLSDRRLDRRFTDDADRPDGVIYLSTAHNRVFAIDAVTGKEIWQYRYRLPETFNIIYGPWNRGVAVGGGRVFMGTLDNSVVALDQKTGRELWHVNVEDSKQCGCNITGAPLLVKDKVIVGVTAGDSAHRGYLNAFDVRPGAMYGASGLFPDQANRAMTPGRAIAGKVAAAPRG